MSRAGAEMQVIYLASTLRRRGWQVDVVSMLAPEARDLAGELEAEGVGYHSLEIRRGVPDPRMLVRLAALLRRLRPQVLHCHMVHANLLGRVVRLLVPVPVLISTAHNIDEGGRLRELLYRLTDPLTDVTTQISQAALERYVEIGAVPRERIRFIPNGQDLERFRPDPRLREQVRERMDLQGQFVWLAVGRFDAAKDYPNMLHAFAGAADEGRPSRLLLVGGDGLEERMGPLARELDIADRVSFLGVRDDVGLLMNGADAYLMSSAWEGMPMVLLEAAASGLPIVTTDVGGNREVVRDGCNGFVVQPRDSQQLADAMRRMMDLPGEQRHAMGAAGRDLMEKEFSLRAVADRWEALYAEFT